MYDGSLVDAQLGDAGAGTPARDFGNVLDELVQAIAPEIEYHRHVLGELAPLPELPHVLLDQLRGAVVVVEHREGAVEHRVVEPADAQVEREQRLDGQQDKPVELGP